MTKRIDLELILTLAARIEGIRTQMAKLDEELSEAKAEMQSAVTGDEPKPEPTPIVAEVTVTELPPLSRNKRRSKKRNRIRKGSDPLVREYEYRGEYAAAATRLNISKARRCTRKGVKRRIVWLTDKEADAVLVEVYTQRIARGGLQAEEYQRRLVNLEQRNA